VCYHSERGEGKRGRGKLPVLVPRKKKEEKKEGKLLANQGMSTWLVGGLEMARKKENGILPLLPKTLPDEGGGVSMVRDEGSATAVELAFPLSSQGGRKKKRKKRKGDRESSKPSKKRWGEKKRTIHQRSKEQKFGFAEHTFRQYVFAGKKRRKKNEYSTYIYLWLPEGKRMGGKGGQNFG